MKSALNLILLLSFVIYLSCQSESEKPSMKATIFSDEITIGNDTRKLYVEFNEENLGNIRWGIENSGRHRIPFINQKFDDQTKSFHGDLAFFGNQSSGSISFQIKEDAAIGKMIWGKDTLDINLKRSSRNLTYVEENISFKNDNTELKGTLILPKKAEKKSPLIVFISGSGCSTRWWGLYWAKELSKIGVASLLYDKRGCGESIGKSWTNSSLDDLAMDVISGIQALEKHPKIDQEKIGLYGVSQGGWIEGRVNGITGKNYFMIVNSGGGVSPYDEEVFSYDIYMKYRGIDKKGLKEGNDLVIRYLDYMATGKNRSELIQSMEANKNKKWFPLLGLDKVLVSEKNRKNWEWIATYKPKEDIRKIKAPVLVMLGGQDYHQPTEVSSKKWKEALEAAENENFVIKIFQEASHGLTVGGHHSSGFPKYANGHLELMKEFILESVLKK